MKPTNVFCDKCKESCGEFRFGRDGRVHSTAPILIVFGEELDLCEKCHDEFRRWLSGAFAAEVSTAAQAPLTEEILKLQGDLKFTSQALHDSKAHLETLRDTLRSAQGLAAERQKKLTELTRELEALRENTLPLSL